MEDARLELLVGKENIEKLHRASILVIGLGGVGSYVVEALARSFVGTLILIDYDTIDITNLNRQLMAHHGNIGKLKTEVLKERIHLISPNTTVITRTEKIEKETVGTLFSEYQFDYVIDACDTIPTKIELLKQCVERNIPYVGSMGMGNKMHPEQLELIDIRKTSYDPIARILRKEVKMLSTNQKIMVVSSREKPKKQTSSVVASNAFVPATAGLLLASYVIRRIVGELK